MKDQLSRLEEIERDLSRIYTDMCVARKIPFTIAGQVIDAIYHLKKVQHYIEETEKRE